MLSDQPNCLEEAEAAALNDLAETLPPTELRAGWAMSSWFPAVITHAGVAYGDATVFESFVAL